MRAPNTVLDGGGRNESQDFVRGVEFRFSSIRNGVIYHLTQQSQGFSVCSTAAALRCCACDRHQEGRQTTAEREAAFLRVDWRRRDSGGGGEASKKKGPPPNYRVKPMSSWTVEVRRFDYLCATLALILQLLCFLLPVSYTHLRAHETEADL
eukprot:1363897-Rhodomonas_salina.8